ncbi:MAG: hypothetical protein IT372_14890 [Polyangiaceae bacterium]|nr:hypothetical protein [Polyangiaceae bacterium]
MRRKLRGTVATQTLHDPEQKSHRDCWILLREAVDDNRCPRKDIANELIIALKRLAKQKHCDREVEGWLRFDSEEKSGARVLRVQRGDARDNRQRPAIMLKNLAHLEDGAVLGIMVVCRKRDESILAYTVSLQGRQKPSGQPWYARIDLDDGPKGEGLCGHPLLHCHVGSDPDDEDPEESVATGAPRDQGAVPASGKSTPTGDRPSPASTAEEEPKKKLKAWSPRVPLPWLFPWEALQWLLSTADPALEAAPNVAPPG